MESACALTKNMEVSFSSSSASRKGSSNESTASSVNYVTSSDTDVSVPARKKTKLSTKSNRTSCTGRLLRPTGLYQNSFFFENTENFIKILRIINITLK